MANEIHFCLQCHNACYVNRRTEVNWEPYGERDVPREEIYETSSCCDDSVRTIDANDLAEYIFDIHPTYNMWSHDEDGTWCAYAGDIDDLEMAVLIEYFGSDKFIIRANKNGDKPTSEEREQWEIYEWMEELMRDQCNYNTCNFTEWHVTVEDNQMLVRWKL